MYVSVKLPQACDTPWRPTAPQAVQVLLSAAVLAPHLGQALPCMSTRGCIFDQ